MKSNRHKLDEIGKLILQANKMRQQKQYSTAIELYLRINQISDSFAALCASIARCYYSISISTNEKGENIKEAVNWMKKAVSISPERYDYHAELAQYYSLGLLNYELAAVEYRRAIDLNPFSVKTLLGAASLYGVPEEVIDIDEATDWLERASQLEQDDPNLHARLGFLYYENGRIKDAKDRWLIALLCASPLDAGYADMIERILLEQIDK